jgi:uncharacterized membrane protein
VSDAAAYEASLPPYERRLAERIVAFGDVVFGFTISQLAFQLELPHVASDLVANPIRYVVYAATFGLIAFCWFVFHRMTSTCFRPTRIDLITIFTFLGWLGLVPYAMFAFVRFATRFDPEQVHDVVGASYGLGAYVLAWIGIIVTSLIVGMRNYRRSDGFLDPAVRGRMWRRLILNATIGALFLLVFIVDVTAGPSAAFPCFAFFALAPLVSRITARA